MFTTDNENEGDNECSPTMMAAGNMSDDDRTAGNSPILEAFAAMDEADDKCSSFADEDREEEERAVADFVSAIELHNGKV